MNEQQEIKTSQQIYQLLASLDIRIFKTTIDRENIFWIHNKKTNEEFIKDVKSFLNSKHNFISDKQNGYSESGVYNNLIKHMNQLGYSEIDDVISNVFEGRIANQVSTIIDDPDHEEQKDGFGHYGWESK